MTPSFRKLVLTAHVTFSVGWLGAVAAFLVLAIAGLTSQDTQIISTAYLAMELTARFVIVPLAFASLLSGFIQSLGTPWGLLRHYWVLVKLLLTTLATIVLLEKVPLIDSAARRAAEAKVSYADLRAAGMPLAMHAAGGLLVLLVITTLSVYKPWGLTFYGRRRQEERDLPSRSLRTAPVEAISDPDKQVSGSRRSRALKLLIATGVAVFVAAVHISMHHFGHTLHHGH